MVDHLIMIFLSLGIHPVLDRIGPLVNDLLLDAIGLQTQKAWSNSTTRIENIIPEGNADQECDKPTRGIWEKYQIVNCLPLCKFVFHLLQLLSITQVYLCVRTVWLSRSDKSLYVSLLTQKPTLLICLFCLSNSNLKCCLCSLSLLSCCCWVWNWLNELPCLH